MVKSLTSFRHGATASEKFFFSYVRLGEKIWGDCLIVVKCKPIEEKRGREGEGWEEVEEKEHEFPIQCTKNFAHEQHHLQRCDLSVDGAALKAPSAPSKPVGTMA